MKQANEWTAAKFREYGLTNVAPGAVDDRAFLDARHGHAAHRGPHEHPLTIASAGWAQARTVWCAAAVVCRNQEDEDFEKYRGKLKGAIVIAQEPEAFHASAKWVLR